MKINYFLCYYFFSILTTYSTRFNTENNKVISNYIDDLHENEDLNMLEDEHNDNLFDGTIRGQYRKKIKTKKIIKFNVKMRKNKNQQIY